jgi:AmmeMemoRadiSam system protein A
LEATVVQAARSAALEDPRFAPVEPAELDGLDVEISVLSEAVPIHPHDIQVGVHGLILEFRGRRGLLLPQVAVEHQLDCEAFLAALCQKAMAPRNAWRDPGANLSAFTAQVHGGSLPELTAGAPGAGGGARA